MCTFRCNLKILAFFIIWKLFLDIIEKFTTFWFVISSHILKKLWKFSPKIYKKNLGKWVFYGDVAQFAFLSLSAKPMPQMVIGPIYSAKKAKINGNSTLPKNHPEILEIFAFKKQKFKIFWQWLYLQNLAGNNFWTTKMWVDLEWPEELCFGQQDLERPFENIIFSDNWKKSSNFFQKIDFFSEIWICSENFSEIWNWKLIIKYVFFKTLNCFQKNKILS